MKRQLEMEILRNVKSINMKIRNNEEKYEKEVQWMERADEQILTINKGAKH